MEFLKIANEREFDQIVKYMKSSHDTMVAKIKEKIDNPEPPIVLSEKQQQVVSHFSQWSYGCQHKEVAKLISILTDIPVSKLINDSSKSNQRTISLNNRFTKEYSGIFIKLNKKPSSDCKIPLNTIGYIMPERSISYIGSLILTSDIHTSTSLLPQLSLDNWKSFIEIATDQEIEGYLKIMKLFLFSGNRWNYFTKVFANAPSTTN